MSSKYIYGPVPSRRLGFSLGIDIIPFKTCDFDCIYCQLGKTTNKTTQRKTYFPAAEIVQAVKDMLSKNMTVDYLSFSGSGEPTLYSKLGYLIAELKKITDIPVTVITNGSLLVQPEVQKALLSADVVLPTLCAATQEIFQKMHRPHHSLAIEKVIHGLINFRKRYKGKIWLEVMIVKGINDAPGEIQKLKVAIDKIKPDVIHLNTVIRPPTEKDASPLSMKHLQEIKKIFGANCKVIADFNRKKGVGKLNDIAVRIVDIVKRRPVTIDDITDLSGLPRKKIVKYLVQLKKTKKIKSTIHKGKNYFEGL